MTMDDALIDAYRERFWFGQHIKAIDPKKVRKERVGFNFTTTAAKAKQIRKWSGCPFDIYPHLN